MAKKAFVLGANYGLNYAKQDAKRIAALLQSLGYELPEDYLAIIDSVTLTKREVLEKLETIIASCGLRDTFIFYFSGHAVKQNNSLFLYLDSYDVNNEIKTILPILDILSCVKQSNSQNQLLILDCCFAGQANELITLMTSNCNNITILAGAAKNKKALEIKELQSGFLSDAFCKAVKKISEVSQQILLSDVIEKNQDLAKKSEYSREIEIVSTAHSSQPFILGESCRQRFEGLLRIDADFIEKQKAQKYVAEDFYSAAPLAQWWGVCRGLVALPQCYEQIETHVKMAVNGRNPLVGLLYGSGGMGKSTVMRALAVALAKSDFWVWWLDDIADFLASVEDKEQLANLWAFASQQFIFIDDWKKELMPDERAALLKLFRQVNKSDAATAKFILSSREWDSAELNQAWFYAHSTFNFDESHQEQDNKALLTQLGTQLPELKAVESSLSAMLKARAKPFHLLFITLRLAEQDKDLAVFLSKNTTKEADGLFRDIVEYDLNRFKNSEYEKGYFYALVLFAKIADFYKLPALIKEDFSLIAGWYNNHALTVDFENNLLKHYLSYNEKNFLVFNKDDFAETIVTLENAKAYLRSSEKNDVFKLIEQGSHRTTSFLLYILATYPEQILNNAEIITLAENCLAQKNTHFAYANLFLQKPTLFKDKRQTYIEQYLAFSNNHFFIVPYLKQLPKLEQITYAQQLLDAGNQHTNVICTCLTLLGQTDTDKAALYAQQLLDAGNKVPEVICNCLTLLGQTDTDKAALYAQQLLDAGNKDKEVICNCLTLLANENIEDEKLIAFATDKLRNWKNENTRVIIRCIPICQQLPEVKEAVTAILASNSSYYIKGILKTPLHHIPEWKKFSLAILENWRTKNRLFLGACLISYQKELDFLNPICQTILKKWETEIAYQKKRNYKVCDFHIIKSLAHPQLRQFAKQTATFMLMKENVSPHFLKKQLYNTAKAIVENNQYPKWENPVEFEE